MEEEKEKGQEKKFEERAYLRESVNLFTLLTGILYGELDSRIGIKDAIKKNLKKPVPSHINLSFCFGGISFFLFLILLVTGVLLLMYYRPTTGEAYESVVLISNVVSYGWL